MRNFVKPGHSITVVAPADVNSGDFVTVGGLTGVAQHDALTGEDVEIVRAGVFTLPKVSAQAWGQGDLIYWSTDNDNCTTADVGNTLIGVAVVDAANPSDESAVLLDGVIR